MKTERNKIINNNKKIKLIGLYSSNSNPNFPNIDYKQINFIPLSRLFKNKLNNINKISNVEDSTKFSSVGKIIISNNHKNINKSLNYNSFSPQKISLIKLPKIRNNKESNELKDSLLDYILNKFDEYDHKFKEQAKISKLNIKRGDKYLKIKNNYLNGEEEKYKNYYSKNNYKKQYSKLFKRIKSMHLI